MSNHPNMCSQPETSASSHNTLLVFSLPKLASSISSSSFSRSKQEFIHSFTIFLHSLFAGANLSTPSFDRNFTLCHPQIHTKRTKIAKEGHATKTYTSPHFNRRKEKRPYIPETKTSKLNKGDTTSNSTKAHTANMLNLNTPLRTIQALLALISLGLNGYGT